jgi:hypothetical protein
MGRAVSERDREEVKKLIDGLDDEAVELLVKMAEMLASRSPNRRRRIK